MWYVSSRSGVATLRTAIHLLLTYCMITYGTRVPVVRQVIDCELIYLYILLCTFLTFVLALTLVALLASPDGRGGCKLTALQFSIANVHYSQTLTPTLTVTVTLTLTPTPTLTLTIAMIDFGYT